MRAVQAIFDDANYPNGGSRAHPYAAKTMGDICPGIIPTAPGTPIAISASFSLRFLTGARAGILAVTVNLQGGGPVDGNYGGSDGDQPQANTGFDPHGNLKPAYAARFQRVIEEADKQGMVVIVGSSMGTKIYAFWQIPRRSIRHEAIRQAALFLKNLPHRNIMIEIDNEASLET